MPNRRSVLAKAEQSVERIRQKKESSARLVAVDGFLPADFEDRHNSLFMYRA